MSDDDDDDDDLHDMVVEGAFERLRKAIRDVVFVVDDLEVGELVDVGDMLVEHIEQIEDRAGQQAYLEVAKGAEGAIEILYRDRMRWASEVGPWIAQAERWTPVEGARYVIKSETVERVDCQSRAQAIAAAKELRARYAADFQFMAQVDVRIAPAGDDGEPLDPIETWAPPALRT